MRGGLPTKPSVPRRSDTDGVARRDTGSTYLAPMGSGSASASATDNEIFEIIQVPLLFSNTKGMV